MAALKLNPFCVRTAPINYSDSPCVGTSQWLININSLLLSKPPPNYVHYYCEPKSAELNVIGFTILRLTPWITKSTQDHECNVFLPSPSGKIAGHRQG